MVELEWFYPLIGLGFLVLTGLTLNWVGVSHTYQLHGTSMSPTIPPGTYLTCLEDFETIREGYIIAYNETSIDYIVIHRVIEKLGDGKYKTKGDNNTNPDRYEVTTDEIICRVGKIN